MIDPKNIVRKYSDEELQELLIFCICVAGKTAATIAPQWLKKIGVKNVPKSTKTKAANANTGVTTVFS